MPSLRADMAHVAAAADRLGDCRLIVIDPVSAYLGGVDDHRNAEVRGILSPLKAMAERLNAAVVLLSHLSKGGSANAQQRVIGSIAYVGACRANFLFVKDREDPTGRRVLMLDNGGNLAPPAPTLAYRIEDRGEGPRVEWLEAPLPITAEEALAADQAACQAGVAAPERREAERWLTDVLSSGPVPAKEVEAAARDAAIARKTLRRARETTRSGIVSPGVREGFHLLLETGRPTRPMTRIAIACPPCPIDAHLQRVGIYGGGGQLWSPNRHDARNRPGGTDRPTVESRTDLEGVARENRRWLVSGMWSWHGLPSRVQGRASRAGSPCHGSRRHQ